MKRARSLQKVSWHAAVAGFSFAIIALEITFFHMLLVVTDYLQATFVISIALLGIAGGGVCGYYLRRVDLRYLIPAGGILFAAAIAGSYYNIANLGHLRLPFLLVLPFFCGSVVIASVFARENSNSTYFANLLASGLGAAFPVYAVSALGSENALIALGLVIGAAMLALPLAFDHVLARGAALLPALTLILGASLLLRANTTVPDRIPEDAFERLVAGEITVQRDAEFLARAYRHDEDTNHYLLDAGDYDAERAHYILARAGYTQLIDLNVDVDVESGYRQQRSNKHHALRDQYQVFHSLDSLAGRVDLVLHPDGYVGMGLNGLITDWIDYFQGSWSDPRFPVIPEADAFIVGLSADGIVKSVKLHDPVRLAGMEINPAILEIMRNDHPVGAYAATPYKDVEVFAGEGRHYLERIGRRLDLITLMNIHPEHPSLASFAPEYFHTIEATTVLLEALSDGGMVSYEEIVSRPRARLFFLRFLNTTTAAMHQIGIDEPRRHIVIYQWDFWGPTANPAFRTVLLKRQPFTDDELSRLATQMAGMAIHQAELLVHPDIELGSELERFLFSEEAPIDSQVQLPQVLGTVEFTRDLASQVASDDDLEFLHRMYRQGAGGTAVFLRPPTEEDENRLITLLARIDYPHRVDLSPITDDRPFPFDVYRERPELMRLLRVVLVAAGVLLVPLLIRVFGSRDRSFASGLRDGHHLLYFATIGFAYILVQIVLMQHFQRFIGSPTYSLLVVLGGFLIFNGIGGLVSGVLPRAAVLACFAAIPVALVLMLLLLDDAFSAFGGAGFVARLFVSVLLIAPIGLLLGVPFPNALELAKRQEAPEYAALLFGVNGAFSTVGATASLIIAVSSGFTFSLLLGAGGYLVAFGLFWLLMRTGTSGREAAV